MRTHCLEDMHHFHKGGLSFASMNPEIKQPSVYLTAKTPLPQYLPYARFLLNAELLTRQNGSTHSYLTARHFRRKTTGSILLDVCICSIRLPTLHEICIVAVQALHAHSQNWRNTDFWRVCTADFQNQAVFYSRFRKMCRGPLPCYAQVRHLMVHK